MSMENTKLRAEIEELRTRLAEAEETLFAIRSGEVDALVVSSDGGVKVFTLEGADQPYRVLVETMSEGAATLTPDSTILYGNSHLALMLGIPLERLLGKPLLAHVAPADARVLTSLLERALGDDCLLAESFRAELTLLKEKGDSVPVLLSCCSLDLAGTHGISVIVTDLSELKLAEKQIQEAKAVAEEASRAKSEFLANMSHEIRTPMTVFMVALEHLLQIDQNPERRQLLEMADQSAQRLRTLIDHILDFSRIEAGRVDLEEEPFDLRACVQSTAGMMRMKAREKNLALEVDLSSELPPLVRGDADRLGQILLNLIGNSIKFTQEGEVRVSVHAREDQLEFAVSDTGIGIPEEKRESIFQSFSQGDSSFKRKFGGSGLGLAISQGLVHLMGGNIEMKGREGGGSVFFFTLPLKPVAEPHPAPAEERQETKRETPFREKRILLAEDEPMIRDMVLMTLARRGWRAEIAENGREAVQKWSEGNFDLIFMDLQMPELDGLEATRQIREKENGHHVCIVGLTAHVRREVKEECLAAGMNNVLSKPVRMEELFSAIESCISGE